MRSFKISKVNTYIVGIMMMAILLCCSSQVQAAQSGDYTYTVTDGKAQITKYTGVGGVVTVPSTLGGVPVTSIGDSAFSSYYNDYCRYISTISLPQGVTSIGYQAFYYCTGLTSIGLPQGVTSIADGAFADCTSLTSISLPQGVISIGNGAFHRCKGLTTVSIPESVTNIGNLVFGNCTGLTSIRFNSATTTIYDSEYTIPATTKIIGYAKSTAKDYATKYNKKFEVIGITNNVTVTGVKLNKNITTINVGANETLSATIIPTNATNKNVTWSSSVPTIAMVDQNGIVKAIKAGTAIITVTTQDGSKTASCTVTAKIAPIVKVTRVSLNKSTTSIDVGDIENLTAAITPSSATNQNITWKSSKTSVATVDSSGKVTGVSAGAAVITVTTVDGKKTATCNVTVKNIPIVFVPGTGGSFEAAYLDAIVNWYNEVNFWDEPSLPRDAFKKAQKNIPKGKDPKTIQKSFKLNSDAKFYIGFFDKTYDTLFSTLTKSGKSGDLGYVKETDLFLFGYDTMETSIEINANNLKNYIKYVLDKTGAKKVNLIGHSQGTLIARQYIQNNLGYDASKSKNSYGYAVNKFIMLAPPNNGVEKSLGAYYMGETKAPRTIGIIQSDTEAIKWMTYYSTGIVDTKPQPKMDQAHRISWVQDKADGLNSMIPSTSVNGKKVYNNVLLDNLNSKASIDRLLSMGKSNIIACYGMGQTTIQNYSFKETDTSLKDGSPNSTKEGDDTVTKSSLTLLNQYGIDCLEIVGASHGDICSNTKVLNKIKTALQSN